MWCIKKIVFVANRKETGKIRKQIIRIQNISVSNPALHNRLASWIRIRMKNADPVQAASKFVLTAKSLV
jgi:hypothetical protein